GEGEGEGEGSSDPDRNYLRSDLALTAQSGLGGSIGVAAAASVAQNSGAYDLRATASLLGAFAQTSTAPASLMLPSAPAAGDDSSIVPASTITAGKSQAAAVDQLLATGFSAAIDRLLEEFLA
ncbi:MAG: hypothetical protein ACKOBW_08985, partial [Planctomycetota bacterium]